MPKPLRHLFALGAALAVLGACAPGAPVRDPEQCLSLFRQYDQVERRYPGGGLSGWRNDRLLPPPDLGRAASYLVAAGCQTFTGDLDGMEAHAATLQGFRITGGPTAIPATSVHLGVLTSLSDETRVTIVFRGLGYASRGVGASGLGRRIYIGPFGSQEAVDQALALARDVGFIAPYATTYPRF